MHALHGYIGAVLVYLNWHTQSCPQCRLNKHELEIRSLNDQVALLTSKLTEACSEITSLKQSLKFWCYTLQSECCNSSDTSYASKAKPHGSDTGSLETVGTKTDPSPLLNKIGNSMYLFFGVEENNKGTPRHFREKHDIENASTTDNRIVR